MNLPECAEIGCEKKTRYHARIVIKNNGMKRIDLVTRISAHDEVQGYGEKYGKCKIDHKL